MANIVLQELPEEMGEGTKVIFPKMQIYSILTIVHENRGCVWTPPIIKIQRYKILRSKA